MMIVYPPDFEQAALPVDVNPSECEHEAEPPVCRCAHDWRIHWGNVKRVSG